MMMRFIPIAVLALAAASPAHAADLSTIDCVGKTLDMAVRAQIEADVARNMADPSKRPTYAPSVSDGLNRAAEACAKDDDWSPAATKAAVTYSLAKIGMPSAQKIVSDKGFDPAALEDEFQKLSEEDRNRPLSTAQMQQLVIASVPEESRQTRANAELLNGYFLFLSTIQYAAWDFSQA